MTAPTRWLDGVSVASPCGVSWEAMSGGDRVRFCGQCRKSVYNLSGMSRAEAEGLVRQAAGGEGLCVRFYRRADGTVLTDDCPVGLKALRRRLAAAAGRAAALFAFLGLGGALSGCQPVAKEFRDTLWPGGVLRGTTLREVEPFRSVLDWVDPLPARRPPHGVATMGLLLPPPSRLDPGP